MDSIYPLLASPTEKAAWLSRRHLDTIAPVRRRVALSEQGYPVDGSTAAKAAFLRRRGDLKEQAAAPEPERGPRRHVTLCEFVPLGG